MASEAPQDVSMSSTPAVPPAADQDQEPKYGGYSRFEIELEVSHHDSHHSISHSPPIESSANPDIPVVCPVTRQSLLSQPPRVAEAPHPARLHRLPGLPPVLVQAAVPQIPDIPRADTAPPAAPAAGEIQAGHYEPGLGPAAG